jgi:hypothetical protein
LVVHMLMMAGLLLLQILGQLPLCELFVMLQLALG